MSGTRATMEEQAIGWIIRIGDARFSEWEAFTTWLEEDPAHADVYDEMASADLDAAGLLGTPRPPAPLQRTPPPRRHFDRRRVIGGAMAAALVAVASYSILAPASALYPVETAAGMRRTIALADGSRIYLNGGTRLSLDKENPRMAQLEQGEAYFVVVHDESRPFIVQTGGATLLDAGTAFNVTRMHGVTEVKVSEGAIIYNPRQEKVALAAGKSLRAVDGEDEVRVSDTESASVASWREGRLIYKGVPLALIAADLSRNLGVKVTAGEDVGATPFSGVILLEGERNQVLRRVGALLGVEAKRLDNGWVLTGRTDGAP